MYNKHEGNFGFSPESQKEAGEGKKYEVEIRREDIDGIKEQMKKEGGRPSQTFAFEGARLNKLKEISPESDIGDIEVTDEAWENSKKRFMQDTRFTREEMAAFKDEKGNNRYKHMLEWTDEDHKSDQIWAKEFLTSDLKNLDPERFKDDRDMRLSETDWRDMADDLSKRLDKEEYDKVIERAGRMSDLDPEKFKSDVLPLFSPERQSGILENIKKSKEDEKANWGEFSKKVRFVSEFSPEIANQITISETDWREMKDYLERKREEAKKDGKIYRDVADALLSLKTMEKLAEQEKIKTV